MFCAICSRDGATERCQQCPRAFHMWCNETGALDFGPQFRCAACTRDINRNPLGFNVSEIFRPTTAAQDDGREQDERRRSFLLQELSSLETKMQSRQDSTNAVPFVPATTTTSSTNTTFTQSTRLAVLPPAVSHGSPVLAADQRTIPGIPVSGSGPSKDEFRRVSVPHAWPSPIQASTTPPAPAQFNNPFSPFQEVPPGPVTTGADGQPFHPLTGRRPETPPRACHQFSPYLASPIYATLLESVRVEPLTKDQQRCRARGADLPPFDGKGERWFRFYTTYVESTRQCGFSASENMNRLEKSLTGAARRHVDYMFEFPHMADRVMDMLKEEFAHPQVLLHAAESLAHNAPTLKSDLKTIGRFAAAVEHIKQLVYLTRLEIPVHEPRFIHPLVAKMPHDLAREWVRRIGLSEGTIEGFHHFVQQLEAEQRRYNAMTGYINPQNPGRSHTLVAVDTVEPIPDQTAADKADSCALKCTSPHPLASCPRFLAMPAATRLQLVYARQRCFRCLQEHGRRLCKAKSLSCPTCGKGHHALLHVEEPNFVGFSRNAVQTTLFKVLPVQLLCDDIIVTTHGLIDSGCADTLISEELAQALPTKGLCEEATFGWMNGHTEKLNVRRVELEIQVPGGTNHRIQACVVPGLALPLYHLADGLLESEGLSHIPVEPKRVRAHILLGQNTAVVTRVLRSVVGTSGKTVAEETPLGWTLSGKQEGESSALGVLFVHDNQQEEDLQKVVTDYIELDQFGLAPDNRATCESDETIYAKTLLRKKTRFVNGQYESGLLWRSPVLPLPDNRSAVLPRHYSLIRKLKKNPMEYTQVDEIIRDYLRRGFAREVKSPEQSKGFYVPIFTVRSPSKPDKVRLVWDAAAECNGPSLNMALLAGPDLTASLIGVLQRFRKGKYAFTGDIEAMFHMVRLREEDTWAQRFLWQSPGSTEVVTYELVVLSFGATCSPAIAQYCKNQNAERFAPELPDGSTAIINNTYVDDHLESDNSEELLAKRAVEVKQIHAAGGFHMHKWLSNSEQVLKALGAPGDGGTKKWTDSTMVLGIEWNTQTDTFSFVSRGERLLDLTSMSHPTKREALRLAMSLYDPLGLLAFVSILPKILMREIWRHSVPWDELIPTELCSMWDRTRRAIRDIGSHSVRRWLGTTDDPIELHVFCDASENVFAACAYAVQRSNIRSTSTLILAKAKVAPLKAKSIPRLELDAAVLGTRVLRIVMDANAFSVCRVVMWTDAKDVLHWLQSATRKYSTYVGNRVGDILRRTEVGMWRWVPTHKNPADWATKWASRECTRLWWEGPEFLHEGECAWPLTPTTPAHDPLELRVVNLATEVPTTIPVPPVTNFSSWTSLVRNTAVVMVAPFTICKKRPRGPPTPEELQAAEHIVLKLTQASLEVDNKHVKALQPIKGEDGLWRMGSRLGNAKFLTTDQKFPIILPRGHWVTTLISRHYHELHHHEMFDSTLNAIRQRFVSAKLRVELNAVIRHCPRCILSRARPSCPQMAPLPPCRLATAEDEFRCTGVDCFGPLLVTQLRRTIKKWGMLFTCLTTRAVYIVLVDSLDTEACLRALRELCARRKTPVEIYSDNGTNFVSAAKVFRGLHGETVTWRFLPPRTPHMGGAWERMIGITKRILASIGFKSPMSEDKLRDLLVQAEFIINNRPLTDVPVDPAEPVALTPLTILQGLTADRRNRARREDPDLLRMAKAKDEVLDYFWDRWTKEYLPLIALRSKWTEKTSPLHVGDIVYLCDDDRRVGWRKGVVDRVYPDAEGNVRMAQVRIPGERPLMRAAAKLAKLSFLEQD